MDSRIIDKIRKLLALGESPNEAESVAAVQKAHELMITHGVSLSDLHKNPDDWFTKSMPKESVKFVNAGKNLNWSHKILACLARLNFCISAINSDGHLLVGGAEPYTTVTVLMFEYLVDACKQRAKKYINQLRTELRNEGYGEPDVRRIVDKGKRDYLTGISFKLQHRIDDLMRGDASNTTEGLVRYGDYDNVLEYIATCLGLSVTDDVRKVRKSNLTVSDATVAGWKAGDQIGLNTQFQAIEKPIGAICG